VIASLALHLALLTASVVASPTASTTKVQTTGLKPLSEEFLVAFCKSSIVIMAASSAATHWALSWCFFWMEEVCEGDTSMKPLY